MDATESLGLLRRGAKGMVEKSLGAAYRKRHSPEATMGAPITAPEYRPMTNKPEVRT